MKKLKHLFRMLVLIAFIALACSGIGLMAINPGRERYLDKEIQIETVEKRAEENEDDTIVDDDRM